MIAKIGAMQRVPMDRPEPRDFAPTPGENFENFTPEVGGPNGIEQKLDRDAFARLHGESFGESGGHLAVPKDILLHGDRNARGFDRLQHGRIKLISVIEYFDIISRDYRHTGGARHGGAKF